jgi:hypothetical protein
MQQQQQQEFEMKLYHLTKTKMIQTEYSKIQTSTFLLTALTMRMYAEPHGIMVNTSGS